MIPAITYETGGQYARAARALKESGLKHGVDISIYRRRDTGSWWSNVAYKQGLLLEFYLRTQKPFLYLDADCTIEGSLDALFASEADILVRHRPPEVALRHNCGVMVVGCNERVENTLQRWYDLVQRYGHRFDTCDQPLLGESARWGKALIGELSPKYNVIPSDGTVTDAIIRHHKASREYRDLGGWRSARLMETALAERMAAWMKKPITGKVLLVGNDFSTRTSDKDGPVEVHTVGWLGRVLNAEAAWVSTDRAACIDDDTLTARRIVPSDHDLGNSADRLRVADVQKYNAERLPPYVHLYYVAARSVKEFSRRELPGPCCWTACLYALLLRGCKKVNVRATPGIVSMVRILGKDIGIDVIQGDQ